MAWITKNRLTPLPNRAEPYITEAIKREIVEKYFPRYPRKQAAMLPLFHLIMHTYGHIPIQAMDEAAVLLEVTPSAVQDAVTFYEEFRFEPTGKYVVNVCRSISCEVCGYEALKAKVREVFGIEPGETTDDGLFTFFEAECMGICERAPAALINSEPVGPLTPEGFVLMLQQLPREVVGRGNGHGNGNGNGH